jgi:beta-galactosidase
MFGSINKQPAYSRWRFIRLRRCAEQSATLNIETTVENLIGLRRGANNCTVYSISPIVMETDAKTNEQPRDCQQWKRDREAKTFANNLRIWDLEDPYLYRVVSVVKSGNKIVDGSASFWFQFRV